MREVGVVVLVEVEVEKEEVVVEEMKVMDKEEKKVDKEDVGGRWRR